MTASFCSNSLALSIVRLDFAAISLLRRRGRLTVPCKRPSPLEYVYCLLCGVALLLLLTVDACDSGGETDRDGENRIESSVRRSVRYVVLNGSRLAYFDMICIFTVELFGPSLGVA